VQTFHIYHHQIAVLVVLGSETKTKTRTKTKTTTKTSLLAFIPRTMSLFPAKNEDSSIDKAGMLLLPREPVDGWLLSTSTTIFSTMDLSKPLPSLPYVKSSLDSRIPARLVPCPVFSQSPLRASTSSDSSDVEQPRWSGSDTTVEDNQISDIEGWDSYFWSQDTKYLRSPLYEAGLTVVSPFQQESNLSPQNRNFASANLSALKTNECPTDLRRSDAVRTPRRSPKSLPRNTYSPFPTVSPLPTPSYDSSNTSWPLRSDSQSQAQRAQSTPLRSRAYTTPANSPPLPSPNVSPSSTLDGGRSSTSHSSTSSGSVLYMRSAPATPDFLGLMENHEKSYFDEDSDDEESTLSALANGVKTRLHIRSASSNSSRGKEKTLKSPKSMRNLKLAGEKVKGMLGMKKSPVG
jgi:hypothetical protein